jgi:hypothetical protein
MGGNAIKKNGKSICGRLPKAQYEIVKEYILSILKNHFVCEIVLELPNKESYGDMDILYCQNCQNCQNCQYDKESDKNIIMRDFIKTKFDVLDISHIVKNGYVMSFAFDCSKIFGLSSESQYFQIDLLRMVSVEHINMSRFYFSYGDVGSIIGRMSNYYGMKFGDEGLWCDVYEQTVFPTLQFDVRKSVGKLMLTSDPREICDFFGYDYDVWKNEIPKLANVNFLTDYNPKLDKSCEIFPDIPKSHKFIFDWLISSRFFDKQMFLFLNSDHRDRQETRPFYKNFLRYIGIIDVGHASSSEGESGGVDRNRQPEAIKYFKKEEDIQKLLQIIERKKMHQSKFSGSQLILCFKELCNNEVKDKDVGEKICLFKKYCIEKTKCATWEEFLDNYEKKVIDEYLQEFVLMSIL